jgi:hypothetical protein
MLLEVLQQIFITDHRFIHTLIECSQIFLILLESLTHGLIYQVG